MVFDEQWLPTRALVTKGLDAAGRRKLFKEALYALFLS